jgi:hypothetical protein
MANLTLGDLRKATTHLPDLTPLAIVYDGGVAYSPVLKIEVNGTDIALIGY